MHRDPGAVASVVALREFGAAFGEALEAMACGPAECARAGLPPPAEDSALTGVALRLASTRDGVVVRLVGADETILDHVYCPARQRPYDLAVFAPSSPGVTLRIGHATPLSEATILQARVFSLRALNLVPERMTPQRDVADSSAWPSDQYAEPDVEDAAGRLRDLAFRRLRSAAPAPWLNDLRIMIEPRDEQSHCLMKWGLYEAESLFVVGGRLGRGGTFVDVGANCGIFTLFAARAVGPKGRVVAIEPSCREFRRLQDNVNMNGLTQVQLVQAAAADAAGAAQLLVAEPRFAGHNTLGSGFAYETVGLSDIVTVPTVMLDDVLTSERRCDMIKLDIEGAELLALRGAERTLARHRPTLVVEINAAALVRNGAHVAQLTRWIEDRGYRLKAINPHHGDLIDLPADLARESFNAVALPQL